MGLKDAVKSVFSKYATFSGRATRSEYWFFYLFNILMFLFLALSFGVFGAIFKGGEGFMAGYLIGLIVYIIYGLVALIPGLAVTVRRLHDTGRSGANYLWVLLPVVGPIVLLVFLVGGSNLGDNAYGPQPES